MNRAAFAIGYMVGTRFFCVIGLPIVTVFFAYHHELKHCLIVDGVLIFMYFLAYIGERSLRKQHGIRDRNE